MKASPSSKANPPFRNRFLPRKTPILPETVSDYKWFPTRENRRRGNCSGKTEKDTSLPSENSEKAFQRLLHEASLEEFEGPEVSR